MPAEGLQTPVVLIVFRRPDVTRRNLEVLRQVRPEQLFVVADGPRPDRPDEAARCAAVRELIDEIDWPCKVERKFAERNLGLEANVELGLDWVFSRVDRAIVLEDDCIPDPSFFRYADELLDRYAEEKQVWQIGGDTHLVPPAMFGEHSYGFSTWASVWGWATWADRWHDHRSEFDRDHARAEDRVDEVPRTAPAWRTHVAVPHPDALVTEAARKHFTFVSTESDGDRYGWDHHWWVTIMRAAADQGDRRELRLHVVGHACLDDRVHGQRPVRAEQQGVPIRPRLGHRLRADGAAAAGAVLHHDRLAQHLPHADGDEPALDVGAGAGGEGHDQPQRPVGEGRLRP